MRTPRRGDIQSEPKALDTAGQRHEGADPRGHAGLSFRALRYSDAGGDAELVADGEVSITIEKNGPYRVCNIPVAADYWTQGQTEQKYVLCRCGKSGNKPFCDGSHLDEGWSDDG
ncbi:MAG: CDGSH iron-sulfur domain-containing protein [Hyphomicrobiales bacterium]|nr:CDGSH iron-sulfur domain-containing protein [Hyphomicrobiales bacterium]MCP4997721.1 CDGSH iron-sulfur domain-containing protein [Hyphomicrobiales bacterium]